jgi:hypothetical protein
MYKIVDSGGEFIGQGFVPHPTLSLSYSKYIIGTRMLEKP